MIRVDLCHSEDEAAKTRLLEVIAELGGRGDGEEFGAGLHRYAISGEELTVYADAWGVDVAGPEALVRKVLAAMAGL